MVGKMRWGDSAELDDDDGGALALTSDIAWSGVSALRVRHDPGDEWSGLFSIRVGRGPDALIVHTPEAVYDELWLRVMVQTQDGWNVNGHGDVAEMLAVQSPDGAHVAAAHLWGNWIGMANLVLQTTAYSCVDPANPTGVLCNGTNMDYDTRVWLADGFGDVEVFSEPESGQWHCLELHARLNDMGMSNGIVESWVDGDVEAEIPNLDLRGEVEVGFNLLRFSTYFPASGPAPIERYLDDIVVATSRVGCP